MAPDPRPLRAAQEARRTDGQRMGLPPEVPGQRMFEEHGFARLEEVAPGPSPRTGGLPNATQQARPVEVPVAVMRREVVEDLLTALVRNYRENEPEEGDKPFFTAAKVSVPAGQEVVIASFVPIDNHEAFVTAIGTNMTDGVDQLEVKVDGLVHHRGLFNLCTLAEARTSRCFTPPLQADKKVEVKVKNNGGADKDVTAIIRGWYRNRLDHDDPSWPGR